MVTLRVKVEVTEDREVTIKLPDDFPVGEAEITVAAELSAEAASEDHPLSPEELKKFLSFKGLPLGEIETGGWAGRGITDSVQFVEELRRRTWRKSDLK